MCLSPSHPTCWTCKILRLSAYDETAGSQAGEPSCGSAGMGGESLVSQGWAVARPICTPKGGVSLGGSLLLARTRLKISG